MLLRGVALIIFGILFPFAVQSKNNEEIVGLSGVAKLRAVAAKARLEHELALHRLRTHFPHQLLLAPNPSESLNSSDYISAKPIPSESTSFYALVTTQIPPKYFDHSDHSLESFPFQSKPTELSLPATLETISFAINNSETPLEFQFTSTNNTDEVTTIYAQSDEKTKFVDLQESTSQNPNDLVMKFRNHIPLIFDNVTATSIMDQTNPTVEVSTASLHWSAHVDGEGRPGNYTSHELNSSSIFSRDSNLFPKQKENSLMLFHDSHNITAPGIEYNNSKQNFSNLINIRKLPSYLSNSSQNKSIFIKPNVEMNTFNNARKEQLMPKTLNIESALRRPHNIPIENKFQEIDNSSARDHFKNQTEKSDPNVRNFNEGRSTLNTDQKEHFTPKIVNIENPPPIETKLHQKGFIHGNVQNESPELNNNVQNSNEPAEGVNMNIQSLSKAINFELGQHHPREMFFPERETENSFSRSNFEMEKQTQMESFNPINEELVQRRQYQSRDKQNQELFLQYLNMIQSQNNQGIIRTAENDSDPSYSNPYIPNSPQITFYPINWKTNEVCESPVQQYQLSPIKYQVSKESSEEVNDKPMAEKFRRLNEKMTNFQLGNYGDDNSARAADPSDPRHFHSHSLEIHHTKEVRPSTYHSSFNKHKEVLSKFHSAHFSFQKNHWKESPSISEQTDYNSPDKHHRKDLSVFSHIEKYPSTTNFQSSSQPLDKQHWDNPSDFGQAANLPSANNFHSSMSLNKQHPKDFGHTEKYPATTNFQSSSKPFDEQNWDDSTASGHDAKLPSSNNFHSSKSFDKQHPEHLSAFGHAENVPSLNNFHSPGKSFDKQHQKDHAENLPSPTNFHSSSKFLDKQHSGDVSHSAVLTPPSSQVTINNQNNFISTESVNGNQNIQIAQSNGAPISQSHQSLRGDQPFDRSELGSPYLFQFPRNADNRRFKRSFPLIKLFTDPNVQLDVPKTLENVGTVARNSFEDRRAPMYHVTNMMGSAKNTVLSTLKIPPQNAIVPSRYKIVDKKSEFIDLGNNILGKVKDGDGLLKQTNENYLGNEIMKTFHKVGNVVRDSVKSGQETLQHMGDVFHNAKKAVSATRHSTPRLLLPYARTAVLKKNKPDKIMLITPRFADLTQENQLVGATQNDDYVKLGDIMDAVGVSNPERKDTGISRLVIQPRKSIVANRKPNFERKLMLSRKPTLQSRFGADESELGQVESPKKTEYFILREDVERNEIDEISNTLANIKNIVGTKTLQDFLMYMKQKFLLEHLKDKLRRVEQSADLNENVGSGLALGNDLMKPFMGRPTKTELANYFRKNGDSIEDEENGATSVSAINPQVYQNYFNETLKVNEKVKNLTEGVVPEIPNLNDDKIGDRIDTTSTETTINMKVPKKLKKPFMGKKVRKDSKHFY